MCPAAGAILNNLLKDIVEDILGMFWKKEQHKPERTMMIVLEVDSLGAVTFK